MESGSWHMSRASNWHVPYFNLNFISKFRHRQNTHYLVELSLVVPAPPKMSYHDLNHRIFSSRKCFLGLRFYIG